MKNPVTILCYLVFIFSGWSVILINYSYSDYFDQKERISTVLIKDILRSSGKSGSEKPTLGVRIDETGKVLDITTSLARYSEIKIGDKIIIDEAEHEITNNYLIYNFRFWLLCVTFTFLVLSIIFSIFIK